MRKSKDETLREAGFVIHSRPNGQQPKWSLLGEVFDETNALALIRDKLVDSVKWKIRKKRQEARDG